MRQLACLLFLFLLRPGPLFAQSYSTNFPLTENPISENGNWTVPSRHGDSSLWGDIETNGSMAYGVSMPTTYGDPTAILTGTWNPSQTATGTVKIVSSDTSCCVEAELRLRMTISANSITGYEITCSVTTTHYLQIVRWNGANGQYVYLNQDDSSDYCSNGDVLMATITGTNPSTINVYKNGTLLITACDNGGGNSGSCGGHGYGGPGGAAGPFTNGAPGMGFYNNQGYAWSTFGFSSFSASAPSYSTNFPLTENPISENGNWTVPSQHGDSSLWGDVRTTPGLALGVNQPTNYGDPTAALTGTWGVAQTETATIYANNVPHTCCTEIELRPHTTISSNSINGYEINCSVAGGNYMQLVRWNGPNGQFVYLNQNGTICHNGDVISVQTIGTNPINFSIYLNGSLVLTGCDNGGSGSSGSCGGVSYSGPGGAAGPFSGGAPGIGFCCGTSGFSTSGFSSFSASAPSGTGGEPPNAPTNLTATVE